MILSFRSSRTLAAACTLAVVGLLAPLAQAETVTDVAGRTIEIATPVKRIILGEGRQIYAIAPLEKANPFEHVIGWKDDMVLYDPDAYRKYLAKFPKLADMPNFGNPYVALVVSGKHGVYLFRENGPERILIGHPFPNGSPPANNTALSPDGCRLAFTTMPRSSGSHFTGPQITWRVLDLCPEQRPAGQ